MLQLKLPVQIGAAVAFIGGASGGGGEERVAPGKTAFNTSTKCPSLLATAAAREILYHVIG